MKYVAGWNQPGYLPEMEPAWFDDFSSAADFIHDEMERCVDSGWYEDEQRWDRLLEEVEMQDDCFEMAGPDGYVYWVQEAYIEEVSNVVST